MDNLEGKLKQLREERKAREKARIDKLKELNLKKYNKDTNLLSLPSIKNNTMIRSARPSTIPSTANQSITKLGEGDKGTNYILKNKLNVPKVTVAQVSKNANKAVDEKPTKPSNLVKQINKTDNKPTKTSTFLKPSANFSKLNGLTKNNMTLLEKEEGLKKNEPGNNSDDTKKATNKIEPKKYMRQSMIPQTNSAHNRLLANNRKSEMKPNLTRKSIATAPIKSTNTVKSNGDKESVFDRLYKPKIRGTTNKTNAEKLRQDPVFRKKVLKDAGLIYNHRLTMFESRPKTIDLPRRSISAIHLKRFSKAELPNCFHKWTSVGEKLNELHLTEVNEDAKVKPQLQSAVKSDRKKSVKFQKGITFNLNAPTGEELQMRLKNWLQKRGKSLDSYHHLQCFGLHHIARTEKDALLYDEGNKENLEQAEGDDHSFTDNSNDRKYNFDSKQWRRASCVTNSDSVDLNTTSYLSLTSDEVSAAHHVDELLVGALNDLSELLREGFDWEQCARWLRALRERFPNAPDTAAYWECMAALEESQGNFPGSVECWEEAIAKGTERAVVEASLDQLLDKFMQLKISPRSVQKSGQEQKMHDVKNVFKSTLIRFAVQQANLRTSDAPKYVATPVRRSSRLSMVNLQSGKKLTPLSTNKRTPLIQLCSSMRQIDEEVRSNLVFVPNKTLEFTP